MEHMERAGGFILPRCKKLGVPQQDFYLRSSSFTYNKIIVIKFKMTRIKAESILNKGVLIFKDYCTMYYIYTIHA
jgi:hypothetical protein